MGEKDVNPLITSNSLAIRRTFSLRAKECCHGDMLPCAYWRIWTRYKENIIKIPSKTSLPSNLPLRFVAEQDAFCAKPA